MAATRKQVREAQQLLRKIGWPLTVDGDNGPKTREAVEDFKRGFNLYGNKQDNIRPFSRVDGRLGPVTLDRLRYSASHGGRCSKNFRYSEFKSKGNGWVKVHRELVKGLEKYRTKVGVVQVLSGYRDPQHNANVGGASSSQHKYATAADLANAVASQQTVQGLRCFSGIGVQRATGKVRHVDTRHAGTNNTTNSTPANPSVWFYG